MVFPMEELSAFFTGARRSGDTHEAESENPGPATGTGMANHVCTRSIRVAPAVTL